MYANNSHRYTHLILALGIIREHTVWGFMTSQYPGIHDIGLPAYNALHGNPMGLFFLDCLDNSPKNSLPKRVFENVYRGRAGRTEVLERVRARLQEHLRRADRACA